ncbi:FkbM family methyltransferase [Patulibacter sp.]|uniref:FkbM family methyltransferase n=1 Tax=Patulibacter sp. TaxID=1912859 RepID=UPI00272322CD|nr:FkbM family methyltransferase [Patulibacter sp.]MDO9407678.1 FkbM family methyltransferase [Patulibacter sp.]
MHPSIAGRSVVACRPIAALVQELKTLAKLVLNHRGRREQLVREYFFRIAKRFTPVLAVDAEGVRFLVSTGDDVIGRVTFAHRGFDEGAMHRLVEVLGERVGTTQPLAGRTVLDVGGNIGTTSVYAVARFGAARAVAFEPEPGNLRLLHQNVVANGLADRVEIVEAALSSTDGEVEFELSGEDGGDHRVRVGDPRSHGDAMGEAERTVVRVPAHRLDSLVSDGRVDLSDVAIMWIDVQGHEAQVLEGARSVLAAGIPVSIEYWPYGLRRAGGLETLHGLIASSFRTVVDLGPPFLEGPPRDLPAERVAELADRYTGPVGFTDLLLLP